MCVSSTTSETSWVTLLYIQLLQRKKHPKKENSLSRLFVNNNQHRLCYYRPVLSRHYFLTRLLGKSKHTQPRYGLSSREHMGPHRWGVTPSVLDVPQNKWTSACSRKRQCTTNLRHSECVSEPTGASLRRCTAYVCTHGHVCICVYACTHGENWTDRWSEKSSDK